MVGFLVVSYTVRCGVVALTFALPLHSSTSTGNGKLEIVFLFHPGHLVVVGLLVVVVLLVAVAGVAGRRHPFPPHPTPRRPTVVRDDTCTLFTLGS